MGRTWQPGFSNDTPQSTTATITEVCERHAWFMWERDRASSDTQCQTLCSHSGNIYDQSLCTIAELNIIISHYRHRSFTALCSKSTEIKVASCPAESAMILHGILLAPLPTSSSFLSLFPSLLTPALQPHKPPSSSQGHVPPHLTLSHFPLCLLFFGYQRNC